MNLDRRLMWAVGVVMLCWLPETRLARAQITEFKTSAPSLGLRSIRVAVFDFDVLPGVDLRPSELTDEINAALNTMDKVTVVKRDQIVKVADEEKISLTGVVEAESATKLGKLLSAHYVVVGRASHIGQTNYVVVKLIDVNTNLQSTVSAKVTADKGLEALRERLMTTLEPAIRELQKPLAEGEDPTLGRVRNAAKPLAGKVVVLDVSESHLDRPLADPAAQVAISQRLEALGITVIVPKDVPEDWKQSLLKTGNYGDDKVDFLLEGEGSSTYATNVQGMISCRARVELRLIPVPGSTVAAADRGVAANVDLVEALAAKTALEDAGTSASDALILQYDKAENKKK